MCQETLLATEEGRIEIALFVITSGIKVSYEVDCVLDNSDVLSQ